MLKFVMEAVSAFIAIVAALGTYYFWKTGILFTQEGIAVVVLLWSTAAGYFMLAGYRFGVREKRSVERARTLVALVFIGSLIWVLYHAIAST